MIDNTFLQTILMSLANEDNKGFSPEYPPKPEATNHIFYAGRTDGIYCAARIIAGAIGFPFYNETIQNYLERWQEASHNNNIDPNQPLIPYLEKQRGYLSDLIQILIIQQQTSSIEHTNKLYVSHLTNLKKKVEGK